MSGYARIARDRFPGAEWIAGEGRWATVAWCRYLTVALHARYRDARRALARIDRHGCGGACDRIHELVDLGEPAPGDRPTTATEED